ncbi:MAG: YdcF family protein [Terracidiphilus sp.]
MTPTQSRSRRRPSRTHRLRHRQFSRQPPNWPLRVALAAAALCVVLLAWATIARQLAPEANTSLTRFDAIIVLGTPADSDGNPTPTQLARVTEAVHEYERGVAPRLILSGGPVRNQFVEARVMARAAHAQGIPDSAIFLEPEAHNTIQNACYSERIIKSHGWHSAEIVASSAHLPRAAIIFSHLPQDWRFEWRIHAAPSLSRDSAANNITSASVETLKTMRYLFWARFADQCEP